MEVVSISTHAPYDGIPHAGGEFYGRHAQLLSESHGLTVVCPWTPANEAALQRPARGSYRRVVVTPPSRRRRQDRRTLATRALPFLTRGPFLRALLGDPDLRALLQRADRIELQWFDMVVLAPRLRRALPGTPLTGVFHDVVSQGHLRMLTSSGAPVSRRLLALVRLVLSVPLEWRAVRALRTAVVLSDKDRVLLERRGAGDRVVVLPPALDEPDMPASPRERPPAIPEVLFVGAMWRPENTDAASWLLREVWPRVRDRVPGARLTIAGANPTAALRRQAEAVAGVELTGQVESLAPCYRRASVAVSPMRLGAGVKLKGVVAMLWGVPVVATTVGAEGIEGQDVFVAVEDDAAAFASAVARVLTDPGPALEVAARAHAWSHARYSSQGHRRVLQALYP
ncbi:Glycosyltransferase involved in cell wall bisynthesis [Geodermatophilus saharensis]|uniref:Glycosyltransferase involved in cell wall bisynthesis n=1 Tax=Geodermatophilus saharensis TaxID=1137994 RepID=A0A239IAC7_9ACTN|nr:glycosyltransferase family 4 protein [Geodermatophilus saharensis]SNS90258.1 Glycosyltransferase involved in cell wall bisynthesis [Geodermatophilus saharensis]